jgi:hypothetical protein
MLTKTKNIPKAKQKLSSLMIKEVYEDNFREEIERLSSRLERYRFISMVKLLKIKFINFHDKIRTQNSQELFFNLLTTRKMSTTNQ